MVIFNPLLVFHGGTDKVLLLLSLIFITRHNVFNLHIHTTSIVSYVHTIGTGPIDRMISKFLQSV